jgi:uridine phosphorylase
MEAETILVVGASVGLAAGALLAVHANRAIDQWLEDFGPAQDAMIRVACEALSHLS